jgi:hypothetical protein
MAGVTKVRRSDNRLNVIIDDFVIALFSGMSKTEIKDKFNISEDSWIRYNKDPEVLERLGEMAEENKSRAGRFIGARVAQYLNRMDNLAMQDIDKRVAYNATVWMLEQFVGKSVVKISSDSNSKSDSTISIKDVIDISTIKKAN